MTGAAAVFRNVFRRRNKPFAKQPAFSVIFQRRLRVFVDEAVKEMMRLMTTERLRPARRGKGRRYSRHADELLAFFALHRVALAAHVEHQFRPVLYSDRTTRLHLRTLVEAGDLAVKRCPGIGQPNVYHITNRGLRKLAEGESREQQPRS